MTEVPTIAGSELKVRLGGLGLPPTWFAERLGVTMRTVVRWFDGGDVSPDVVAELEKLSSLTLEKMLEMIAEIPDEDPVTLQTYRTDKEFAKATKSKAWPASWHRALTFRVMEHLRAQGRVVTVEYH